MLTQKVFYLRLPEWFLCNFAKLLSAEHFQITLRLMWLITG